jgi:putative hydrolase of the HAD superfamily
MTRFGANRRRRRRPSPRSIEHYVQLYEAGWTAVPEAVPTLQRLAGLGLGLAIVTNGDGVQQRAKLERMGLRPWIDWVLVSGEVGAAKPSPVIFQRLLADSGARPAAILFVGDRRDKDVDPAREMGMSALQIDHYGRLEGPDVVHSLPEVVAWVERERQSPQEAASGGVAAAEAD